MKTLGALLLLLTLTSCNFTRNKKSEAPNDSLEAILKSDQTASFAVIQNAILEKRCTTCHSSSGAAAKWPLTDYAQVKSYVNPGQPGKSPLLLELINNGGSMPKGGSALPDTEYQILHDWILAGAHEEAQKKVTASPDTSSTTTTTLPGRPSQPDTSTTTSTTIPVRVVFDDVYQKVLKDHCIICHSSDGKANNYPFTSYSEVTFNLLDPDLVISRQPENSTLYDRVIKNKMPSPRAIAEGTVKALTAEQKELIRLWILQGAVEK